MTPRAPIQKLTAADHEIIKSLAARGSKAGRIAGRIGKKASTVYWYMLRNGIIDRAASRRSRFEPYRRGTYLVYPYTPDEDAYIVLLRVQKLSCNQIAERATLRFQKPRNGHSIFVRLTILAATEPAVLRRAR